jgi:predicted AAA+ superfamily ATPase
MKLTRYLQRPVTADLSEKMVFVAGPRQVGKTTMATQILETHKQGVYLSWDRRADRAAIREARWPIGEALVVLDEVHKYRQWKRWIKGEFDTHRGRLRFLVTGSARLDVYRRGGDSLQGRYHHYRLHPLSVAEIMSAGKTSPLPEPGTEIAMPTIGAGEARDALGAILRFGGFPEPFLRQSARHLRRWQKERLDRFFREDVRDLESVRDMSSLEHLADLITERVASLLSINALREDLEVSHRAVTGWIGILERLYHLYLMRPYDTRRVRSLKKMPKAYLWESGLVDDPGARFENVVALHLLKFCHLLEDAEGHRVALHFLRDTSGREVDFLVTHDRKPWFAVEVKLGSTRIDPSLRYFRDRLQIPWVYQVVLESDQMFVQNGVHCVPAHRFLAALA